MIRPAEASDLAEILAIYNSAITETTAVYSEDQVTFEERARWLEAQRAAARPVLVALDGRGRVAGFSSYGPFRSYPGFRFTAEASVYVAADARGQGTGRALLSALITEARRCGLHVLVAAIDAQNTPSLKLAEGLGFRRCGQLAEVGFKFGRFLDLVLLEKRLSGADQGA